MIPKEFEKIVILSQITQAEAIQYGVEYWRQNRNEFHCMGSLYWQLNDCWPVASWSSFDYFGRWKALHYFARRFYSPLLPSVRESNDSVELWITNDFPITHSIKYFWKLLNLKGEILKQDIYEVNIPPCTSKMLEHVDLSVFNTDSETIQNNIMFYGIEGEDLLQGFRLFNAPKRFGLSDPKISWNLVEIDEINKEAKIQIRTEGIALFVFIESEAYDFIASDNFFSMEPNSSRTIRLKNIKRANPSDLQITKISKDQFKIFSLYNLLENS